MLCRRSWGQGGRQEGPRHRGRAPGLAEAWVWEPPGWPEDAQAWSAEAGWGWEPVDRWWQLQGVQTGLQMQRRAHPGPALPTPGEALAARRVGLGICSYSGPFWGHAQFLSDQGGARPGGTQVRGPGCSPSQARVWVGVLSLRCPMAHLSCWQVPWAGDITVTERLGMLGHLAQICPCLGVAGLHPLPQQTACPLSL